MNVFPLSLILNYNRFFTTASHLQVPVVMWRLPHDSKIMCIADLSAKQTVWDYKSSEQKKGYVLNSFENQNPENALFINASISYEGEADLIIDKSDDALIDDILAKDFLDFFRNSSTAPNLPNYESLNGQGEEKIHFIEMAKKAISAIQGEEFKKVVLARKSAQPYISDSSVVDTFFSIATDYPNAFVSLSYHPQVGCWIGASPELLMSIEDNRIFKTVALAGTQRLADGVELSEITWSQKEIEEQALVARYIINCFKAIRLREYDDVGPRTVRAGNLVHLQTDFVVDMAATGYPDLAAQMIKLLHPTSAVCGMPKDAATKFLEENENLDRKLFAGYCGPINYEGKTSLYVNLRCANLFQNAAVLYAGAGITKDSNPDKEWEETSAKMETIGKYFLTKNIISE